MDNAHRLSNRFKPTGRCSVVVMVSVLVTLLGITCIDSPEREAPLPVGESPSFGPAEAGQAAKPVPTFISRLGTKRADTGSSVTETGDGGFIIAGWTEAGPGQLLDALLTRVDSLGRTIWQRRIGGSRNDLVHKAVPAQDGGIVAVGMTRSYGGGDEDILLFKVDPNGDLLWLRNLSEAGDDEGVSLTATLDGGFVIIGSTRSFGGDEIYLLKTDGEGEPLWYRRLAYGGSDEFGNFPGYGQAKSVCQASDGGFIMTANRFVNVMIIKTDWRGFEQWRESFIPGGPHYGNAATAVIESSDGGFVATGFWEHPGYEDFHAFVQKLTPRGNLVWFRYIYDLEVAYSLTESAQGGFVLAGVATLGSPYDGPWGPAAVVTDAEGNQQWVSVFPTETQGDFQQVLPTGDGGYIFAGTTSGGPGQDLLLVKTDARGIVQTTPPEPPDR